MKKKSTNKNEAKKSPRTSENEITPKTKGMGTYRITILMLFTFIVECRSHETPRGNERACHEKRGNQREKIFHV